MMQFICLLAGTVTLAASGVLFVCQRPLLGFVVFLVGIVGLVLTRREWPADQDFYHRRNFTRGR